jgi:hypothetical protein
VQAERWSATQDCATRREPRKTLTDYFIAAGCGAAGLDQWLNLAINAGLADPRLKARLDEIGLFDERDVRRGGQDSSLAGACLRQSGSAQPTTRFSICLGVGLNRRRLRPPEAVQRLRSGGGKGPQPPAASYRALRASARRGGGAWHDSTVRNLLARAGCSGG